MSKISRRDFLKGSAALAATGILGACAAESATCEPTTCPPCETNSTTPVASNENAWLGVEPTIADSEISETFNCEVLVVGLGHSGIFATAAAAEEGAKVIGIDQWDEYASSGIRDTLGAIGSKQQIANNDNPDKFKTVQMLQQFSNGYGSFDLHKLWADNSGEMIDWYADICKSAGIDILHEVDRHDLVHNYQMEDVGHSIQWGENEYSETFSLRLAVGPYAISKGADLQWNKKMVKLIKEGSRVTGVIAQDTETDKYIKYVASKGVILATGGYAKNKEMLKALQPETLRFSGIDRAFPGLNGDGIKAALWAGAQFDDIHSSMLFERGCIKPDQIGNPDGIDPDGELFWMGSQPFLKVNLDGKRFTNEAQPYDYILHTVLNQKDQTYCMVWDANYSDIIPTFETHGCSRLAPHANGTESVFPKFYITDIMNPDLEERGYIVKADTIEELAGKLNIPADTFKATVERYNALCAKGVDEDYGKESYRLSPMSTAPFYGIRQSGGYLIATMDGVKIDASLHVLDKTGRPMEGLYAVGDCSGCYFATSYPNLLAGAAAGRSATFGRLAGKWAAQGK